MLPRAYRVSGLRVPLIVIRAPGCAYVKIFREKPKGGDFNNDANHTSFGGAVVCGRQLSSGAIASRADMNRLAAGYRKAPRELRK